jgi:hypothetical protein
MIESSTSDGPLLTTWKSYVSVWPEATGFGDPVFEIERSAVRVEVGVGVGVMLGTGVAVKLGEGVGVDVGGTVDVNVGVNVAGIPARARPAAAKRRAASRTSGVPKRVF